MVYFFKELLCDMERGKAERLLLPVSAGRNRLLILKGGGSFICECGRQVSEMPLAELLEKKQKIKAE